MYPAPQPARRPGTVAAAVALLVASAVLRLAAGACLILAPFGHGPLTGATTRTYDQRQALINLAVQGGATVVLTAAAVAVAGWLLTGRAGARGLTLGVAAVGVVQWFYCGTLASGVVEAVPTGVAVGSVAVCFAGGLTSVGALCCAAATRTARYARRA